MAKKQKKNNSAQFDPKDKNLLVLGKSGVFVPNVPTSEILLFTDNLSTMLEAGVPIVESLEIVREQTKNKLLKDIIYLAKKQVEGGRPLYFSLTQFPDVFDKVFLNVVESGELSGTLADTLKYLTKEIETRDDLQQKIISVMIYPVLILVAMVAVVVFMLVAVIPQLQGIYRDSGQDLPLITQMLIDASDFMTSIYAIYALVGLCIVLTILILFFRSKSGKKVWDDMMLNIPIFSGFIIENYLQRLSRTLSLTLKSGVPIIESLALVGDTMPNVHYQEMIVDLSRHVERGRSISGTIMDNPKAYPKMFPTLFVRIISVGEKTGNLSESLMRLSNIYNKKISKNVKRISSFIEPVMLMIIGVVVAVMVLAVTLPIYQLPNTISAS